MDDGEFSDFLESWCTAGARGLEYIDEYLV